MVNPVRLAITNDLAGPKGPVLLSQFADHLTGNPDLHPRRGSRRHLLRAMTTETRVRSGEFNAVHEDNGRDVNPQQEDHDRGNRALNEGQPRIARDVKGEA